MSRQAAEVGTPESEYLTVPRSRKFFDATERPSMAGSCLVGSGKWMAFRCARTLFDRLADVPNDAVQTPHKITRYTADIRRNRNMAWLEKDRHGRLRSALSITMASSAETARVSANKQTIAEARRLCATIQLELKARTFDYSKRFPNSDG